MRHETAGDPITGLKWTRKTTEKIAAELNLYGITVCANTVSKLLKSMGFSLKVNHKKLVSGITNPPDPDTRNKQFEYIKNLRNQFTKEKNPIISVDTKKKELIGQFKNDGQIWVKKSIGVNDHDFPSDATGKAVPYGIYDILNNRGSIFVGTSSDTPAFAVDSVESWWLKEGVNRYPKANKILILADSGGSNSSRSRVWKYKLHKKMCNEHNLTVSVCHYPPGTSKWNPIEHRLFAEISKNWAGKPLDSFETVLKYIRTTETLSGLLVKAYFVRNKYKIGEKVSNKKMKSIPIKENADLPLWNYILKPEKM